MRMNGKSIFRASNSLLKGIFSRQFIVFCVIGSLATVLNYGIFWLLYHVNVQYIIASAGGYVAGVFVGFALNRRFTFKTKSEQTYSVEVTKYLLVYFMSLLLGLGLLSILVKQGLDVRLANIFVIGLTTFTNYTGCKFFVFADDIRYGVNFIIYRYKYLLRYVVIGFGSLICEALMIELIRKVTGEEVVTYAMIFAGFVSGVVFSFILNSKLNFQVRKERNLRTFKMFLIVSVCSFALNLIVTRFVGAYIPLVDYFKTRFFTAGSIFIISYLLHRKYTFTDVKEVGVAVYLSKSENVDDVKKKIGYNCDFIHIDLVDSTYNSSSRDVDIELGEQIRANWPALKKMTHVMSKNPSRWIPQVQAFSDHIIFHYEIDENIDEVIKLIKSFGKKPGIAIFYHTEVDKIVKYLPKLNIVQILGIAQPGKSGQNLDAMALERLEILNDLKYKHRFDICFDGGVKLSNVSKINAKYVVSGSTVLNAQDPVRAIYDLKTNSRYYLEHSKDLRSFIVNGIKRVSDECDWIRSTTIVGSFAEGIDLEGISDIDVVLIVDALTKEKFTEVISRFERLGKSIKTDFDFDCIVNSTFGPLKFNKADVVVFHVMVYDVEGHKVHCEKSPFTCLDWQNSKKYFKKPMSAFGKVTVLQPNYFFNARRSVKEYLRDLKEDSISYRSYEFKDGSVCEKSEKKKMEDKDRFEFTYHVMKFCMLNCLKLQSGEYYGALSQDELLERYFAVFPKNKSAHCSYFSKLKGMKRDNEFRGWLASDESAVFSFLSDFEEQFNAYFISDARKIVFMRHQATDVNDEGVFLGQKVDPGIKKIDESTRKSIIDLLGKVNASVLMTSPLKRARETVEEVHKELGIKTIVVNDDLLEIDYGSLDGKPVSEVDSLSALRVGWEKGMDPRFPGGENTADVLKRVMSVLDFFAKELTGNAIACTHNVFLRCLIGHLFQVQMREWHLIRIPHVDPIEVVLASNGKFYINLTEAQRKVMFENIWFRDGV